MRLNRLDVQMQNEYRNELRNIIDTRSTAQSTIDLTFRNVIRFRVVWLRRKRDRSREFERWVKFRGPQAPPIEMYAKGPIEIWQTIRA